MSLQCLPGSQNAFIAGIIQSQKPCLPKPKKPKREKDESGLWKGTKKSYTYELTNKGYTLERITRRVMKKFPEAKPKSIQQWYRAALRKKGIDYRTLK